MHVEKLNIYTCFDQEEVLLGQMVLDGRDILFKYADAYLETGHSISPKKMAFNSVPQVGPPAPFGGLFGVFADALPDAWGFLLLRKHLSQKNIALATLNALEKLAFTGKNGLGALTFHPSFDDEEEQPNPLLLDELDVATKKILRGDASAVIDRLFDLGGSPGGARPKVYAGYNADNKELISASSQLPEGFAHCIIKFGAPTDPEDIAHIEMAYHLMATEAGIEMSKCTLLSGESGKKYFGTERFDRIGNQRLHMISMAGLVHDDFERSQIDYGTLMFEGGELLQSAAAYSDILRLAAFNVFAHNRDDHSKNFAFLMNPKGEWKLAPAYDLTFSSSSQGLHSTTCAGNGRNPGTKELLELSDAFSVRNGKHIIQEVKDVVSRWDEFARLADVSKDQKSTIGAKLSELLRK